MVRAASLSCHNHAFFIVKTCRASFFFCVCVNVLLTKLTLSAIHCIGGNAFLLMFEIKTGCLIILSMSTNLLVIYLSQIDMLDQRV